MVVKVIYNILVRVWYDIIEFIVRYCVFYLFKN